MTKINHMKPRVSIIIPIYNREKYLEECIISALKQTLKNIEIICVNDGSTDDSLKILRELQEDDNRIKIFSQSNQGPGAARNLGIKKAKGKYITFLDSDDSLKNSFCKILFDKAEKSQADMVTSNAIFIWKNGKKTITRYEKDLHKREKDAFTKYYQVPPFCWGKLYHAEKIKTEKIKFPTDIKVGEDFCFVLEFLLKSKNFYFVSAPIYIHETRVKDSITSKFDSRWNDIFIVAKRIRFLTDTSKNMDPRLKIFMEHRVSHSITYHFEMIKGFSNRYKYYKKWRKHLDSRNIFPNEFTDNYQKPLIIFIKSHKNAFWGVFLLDLAPKIKDFYHKSMGIFGKIIYEISPRFHKSLSKKINRE